MYDLNIHASGGIEAAEVVADLIRSARARMAAGSKVPASLHDPRLARAWMVVIGRHANVKQAMVNLVPALLHLEGRRATDSTQFAAGSAEDHLMKNAGLEQARAQPLGRPGDVRVFAGIMSTFSTLPVDALVRYVSEALDRHPDIARKLAAGRLARRHAVLIVTVDRINELMLLDCEMTELPGYDPVVDSAITDVWLLPASPGDRVLHWSRGSGWSQPGFTGS